MEGDQSKISVCYLEISYSILDLVSLLILNMNNVSFLILHNSQLPNLCQSSDIGLGSLYCGRWRKISKSGHFKVRDIHILVLQYMFTLHVN